VPDATADGRKFVPLAVNFAGIAADQGEDRVELSRSNNGGSCTAIVRVAMLGNLGRIGLTGLLGACVTILGCTKAAVQEKKMPDPLVHSSKKPITPGYHVAPEQHTRVYPAPPPIPGTEPVRTAGNTNGGIKPVKLQGPVETKD
jgi:hypothetical protein